MPVTESSDYQHVHVGIVPSLQSLGSSLKNRFFDILELSYHFDDCFIDFTFQPSKQYYFSLIKKAATS